MIESHDLLFFSPVMPAQASSADRSPYSSHHSRNLQIQTSGSCLKGTRKKLITSERRDQRLEKLLTQSRFSIRGYLKKKQTQAALGTHFSGIPDQYECKPRNRKREGKNLPGSHFNHQTVWSRPAHDVAANFRFPLTSCGIFFNYVCDAIAIDHFVLCPSLEPTILMKMFQC